MIATQAMRDTLYAAGWEFDLQEIQAVLDIAASEHDAARWRWWKQHLKVERNEPGAWTCWVEMPCIPFRSQTASVDELTDALITRFPAATETDAAGHRYAPGVLGEP